MTHPTTIGMMRRRALAGGLLAGWLLPARAVAADLSSQLFVERIYSHYTGRAGTEGVAFDSAAAVRQLFDPPLAALILADQARSARREEPPALDADPFVDAQDWVIRNLSVAVTASDAQRATATVTFTNFDKPKTIRLELVRLATGWRVHEIIYSQVTLTQILTAN